MNRETIMATLLPVAVALKRVSGVIGSKDKRLLSRLTKEYQDEFAALDERVADLEEEGTPDEADEKQINLQAFIRLLKDAGKDPGKRDTCKLHLATLVRTRGLARLCPALDQAQAEIEQKEGLSRREKKAIDDTFTKLLTEILVEEESPGLDSAEDGDEEEDETRSPRASTAEVLRHLITGEKPKRRVAFKFQYGYALQYLCLHLGEELPHDRWYDLRGSQWTGAIDNALRSVGVPAKVLSVGKNGPAGSEQVGHLAERGSPIPIPKYRESDPSIGYLKGAEVGRALAALEDAELDALDPKLRECLEDIRDWLRTCSDSKRDLICFCEW
jgi:hypothetical protein